MELPRAGSRILGQLDMVDEMLGAGTDKGSWRAASTGFWWQCVYYVAVVTGHSTGGGLPWGPVTSFRMDSLALRRQAPAHTHSNPSHLLELPSHYLSALRVPAQGPTAASSTQLSKFVPTNW